MMAFQLARKRRSPCAFCQCERAAHVLIVGSGRPGEPVSIFSPVDVIGKYFSDEAKNVNDSYRNRFPGLPCFSLPTPLAAWSIFQEQFYQSLYFIHFRYELYK